MDILDIFISFAEIRLTKLARFYAWIPMFQTQHKRTADETRVILAGRIAFTKPKIVINTVTITAVYLVYYFKGTIAIER